MFASLFALAENVITFTGRNEQTEVPNFQHTTFFIPKAFHNSQFNIFTIRVMENYFENTSCFSSLSHQLPQAKHTKINSPQASQSSHVQTRYQYFLECGVVVGEGGYLFLSPFYLLRNNLIKYHNDGYCGIIHPMRVQVSDANSKQCKI